MFSNHSLKPISPLLSIPTPTPCFRGLSCPLKRSHKGYWLKSSPSNWDSPSRSRYNITSRRFHCNNIVEILNKPMLLLAVPKVTNLYYPNNTYANVGESMKFEIEKLGCSVLFHVWIKSTQAASRGLYATLAGCFLLEEQLSSVTSLRYAGSSSASCDFKEGGGGVWHGIMWNTQLSCKNHSCCYTIPNCYNR